MGHDKVLTSDTVTRTSTERQECLKLISVFVLINYAESRFQWYYPWSDFVPPPLRPELFSVRAPEMDTLVKGIVIHDY